MVELRTARLLLRPVVVEDRGYLTSHWNDPDVRRYLFDDEPVTAGAVDDLIATSVDDFARARYGLWLLERDGAPIGCCGLRLVDGTTHIEILYSLEPSAWGQGLATEAADAVLAHAFGSLGLPAVVGGVDEPNVASRRVLERLGMQPFADPRLPEGVVYLRLERATAADGGP